MHSSLSIATMTGVLDADSRKGTGASAAVLLSTPQPSTLPPSGDEPDGDIFVAAGRWGDSAASTACTTVASTAVQSAPFISTLSNVFSFSLTQSSPDALPARLRCTAPSRAPSAPKHDALAGTLGDNGADHVECDAGAFLADPPAALPLDGMDMLLLCSAITSMYWVV